MKKVSGNLVTVMLAALVFVASSGFTVFHHSCRIERISEYSLIIQEFSCRHLNEESTSDMPSCCSFEQESKKDDHGGDKCCNTETIVVKLDITLKTQNIQNTIDVSERDQIFEQEYEVTGSDNGNSNIIISNNLPPPLSGKALHIFLLQLNIPYPAV